MKNFFKNSFYNPRHKYFVVVNNFLSIATLLAVLVVVLETVQSLSRYESLFRIAEYVFVSLFTLEYLGRILGTESPLRYVFSFFGVVDLLSILPTYLGLGNLTFLKSLRTLRVLRFLRMLRLVKMVELRRDKERRRKLSGTGDDYERHLFYLTLEIYLVTLISVSLFSATVIWLLEGGREVFSSIPLSMLWAVKVLLGGVPQAHPNTVLGELTVIFTRFSGLVLFALLINIVLNPIKRYLLNSKSEREL